MPGPFTPHPPIEHTGGNNNRTRPLRTPPPQPQAWLGRAFRYGFGLLLFLGVFSCGLGAAALPAAPSPLPSDVAGPLHADPFPDLHRHELPWILRFQGDGRWGGFMKQVSNLGPSKLLSAAIAILFFAIHPKFALRLALLLFLANWTREVLALTLQSPRPYWIEPELLKLTAETRTRFNYGLPSGHAFVGTVVWVFAATAVRHLGAKLLFWFVPIAISISRVYLAAHFISDVLLGLVLGVAFTLGWLRIEHQATPMLQRLTPARLALASLVTGLALCALAMLIKALVPARPLPPEWLQFGTDPRQLGITFQFAGLISGLGLAVAFMRTGPSPASPWNHKALRLVVGCGLGFLLSTLATKAARAVANEPIGPQLAVTFITAAAAVWTAFGLLTWAFRKVGWDQPLTAAAPAPGQPE